MSKLIFFLLSALLAVNFVYSNEIFTCTYEKAQNCQDNERLFYAFSNLSSNVRVDSNSPYPYEYTVCCKSENNVVKFNIEAQNSTTKTINCPSNEPLLYFTGDANARVAREYNSSYHHYGLCYDVPDKSYVLSINFVPKEGLIPGFECLFRTSDTVNGVVSSCDSTFNGGNTYQYSVVAQLFSGMDVLSCNYDCTNKLTGRVDFACSLKLITQCKNVPVQCSGSLPGAWVSYNSTSEIQCSSPWNIYRSKMFTSDSLKIETTSGECENLIKVPYSVFVNNEVVTMNIFVCQN